jgi:hypothetical protein
LIRSNRPWMGPIFFWRPSPPQMTNESYVMGVKDR